MVDETKCDECGEPHSEERILSGEIFKVVDGKELFLAAQALVHTLAILIIQHSDHPADMKMLRDNCVALLFETTGDHIEEAYDNLPDTDKAETNGDAPARLN